jgi:hypothetical protein
MARGNTLEFDCQKCRQPVRFSLFELDHHQDLTCSHCWERYVLDDENLLRQLKQFEALCRQIQNSEEILSHTSVGVDVGEHQVKIPFKLLLTRLSSCLDLKVGDSSQVISFRFEPLADLPRKKI